MIIIPEIVTRKSELKKWSCYKITCDKENNNKVFCFCNGPETPEMIGCDNPECTTGNQWWFHFPCIKMKRPPKGKWLCPVCKKIIKVTRQYMYLVNVSFALQIHINMLLQYMI